MSLRLSWILMCVGGALMIFGIVTEVALYDYTIFSFPITSWVDTAGSSLVALAGLAISGLGFRGFRRRKAADR